MLAYALTMRHCPQGDAAADLPILGNKDNNNTLPKTGFNDRSSNWVHNNVLSTFLLASSMQLPVQQVDALKCSYICDLQLGRSLHLMKFNALLRVCRGAEQTTFAAAAARHIFTHLHARQAGYRSCM